MVLAAAGDVPTLEVIAAAWLLRRHAPALRVRIVNVVDLMTLFAPRFHPHGLTDEAFVALFTETAPVVFAFHGYPLRPRLSTSPARRALPCAVQQKAEPLRPSTWWCATR